MRNWLYTLLVHCWSETCLRWKIYLYSFVPHENSASVYISILFAALLPEICTNGFCASFDLRGELVQQTSQKQSSYCNFFASLYSCAPSQKRYWVRLGEERRLTKLRTQEERYLACETFLWMWRKRYQCSNHSNLASEFILYALLTMQIYIDARTAYTKQ